VKNRLPSSSLSHAADLLASKATFDSKPALQHKLRVQLRISILQSIDSPRVIRRTMWWRGAKLQTGVATRTSISTRQTGLSVPESKLTRRYPATSPVCQNLGR